MYTRPFQLEYSLHLQAKRQKITEYQVGLPCISNNYWSLTCRRLAGYSLLSTVAPHCEYTVISAVCGNAEPIIRKRCQHTDRVLTPHKSTWALEIQLAFWSAADSHNNAGHGPHATQHLSSPSCKTYTR